MRRCVGCGRRAPKSELRRFLVREGLLTPATSHDHGRSAYTCRRLSCFERAVALSGFARTLRTSVNIDPELVRLYTDADG